MTDSEPATDGGTDTATDGGTDTATDGATDTATDGATDSATDTATDTATDGGDPSPEEMDLDQLREEIEGIDREIVELIARRTYVADTIAAVKDERGLPTTDEQQEQQVMDRAAVFADRFDVEANLVKAIFRLLIELNKVEQREKR